MTSKPARKVARPTRGSLVLIAGFLLASGLIRVGAGAGQVLALEKASPPSPSTPVQQESCEPSPDFKALTGVFEEREARIAQKEREMEDRMQALSVADAEVSKKLRELTQAEEKLRATIAIAEDASEADVTRLTQVYETMKPKDAAALFERMEPEFAAGFLGRMKPAAAAGVMAGMSPDSAYTISVVLAGRNANVPKE